ncbi:MAG TPA: S-layer homology domain-containing protein, partial [Clostridiaceae bacterium]|nr:S-layer homology domain-containing protein [Clostridiaceae bacterium]
DFTITSGDKVISDLGGGTATISIPYTPKAGEDLNAIVIYHITGEGELVLITDCIYDAETGALTFKLSHFSRYAVGYNKVEFTDTEGSWAKDYITYLSARNIINGDGTGRYLPGNNITRAEFTKILAGIAGIDPASYRTSAFQDMDENAWYAPYVAWATENGIVKGYGNGLFGPDDYISREQIALMISRFASVQNYTLPEAVEAIEFADSDKISSYAREAVEKVQRAGIINGRPSGDRIVFASSDNADRAEAAKMLAVLMKSMMK